MEDLDDLTNRCLWCSKLIEIQIFKGTGACSENHRKQLVRWKKNMNDLYPEIEKKEGDYA